MGQMGSGFISRAVCAVTLGASTLVVQAVDETATALREAKSETLKSSGFASSYAAIINFASEPDISSSTLWVDNGLQNDDRLKVIKFPFRHEFGVTDGGWHPFVQATVAKLSIEQTIPVLKTDRIELELDSYSVTIGGGVRIPLSGGWSLLPAIDTGYANVGSDIGYSGALDSPLLKPEIDKILIDWSADAWLTNVHLALQYQGWWHKLAIDAKLSGTLSHIASYRTSSDLRAFSENIGTISLKVDGTYPLGVSVAGYPLAVIGHLGSSTLVGSNRDALGFTYLNEAGLSLQVDLSNKDLPVSKLSIGAMGFWGDNVKGWSVLFGYRF